MTVAPWPGAGRSERPLGRGGRTVSPQAVSRARLGGSRTVQRPGHGSPGTRSPVRPPDTCGGSWMSNPGRLREGW